MKQCLFYGFNSPVVVVVVVVVVQYGWTALLWTCDSGNSDMVDYLLEHGADANVCDVSCYTLLNHTIIILHR